MYFTLFYYSSTFSPQASSPLEHSRQTDRRTDFFTPCSLCSYFSLSTRGPTRRRNSTGLAELWGGWPIEPVLFKMCNFANFGRTNMIQVGICILMLEYFLSFLYSGFSFKCLFGEDDVSSRSSRFGPFLKP